MRDILLATLGLWLLTAPAFAIYEDQAGVIDWHRRQLGRVTEAVVREQRSFVATSTALVAAVRHSDGELLWRYEMPNGEAVARLKFLPASGLLVLSEGGRSLRKLSLRGSLVWDLKLVADDVALNAGPEAAEAQQRPPPELELVGNTVLVLADNAVTAVDAASGSPRFEFFPENDEQLATQASLAPDSLLLHGLRVDAATNAVTVVATGRAATKQDATKLLLFRLGEDGVPAEDVGTGAVDVPRDFAQARVVALQDRVVLVADAELLSVRPGKAHERLALASLGVPAGESVLEVVSVESRNAMLLTLPGRHVSVVLAGDRLEASREDPGADTVVGVYTASRRGTVAVLRAALRDGELQLAADFARYVRTAEGALSEDSFREQLRAVLTTPFPLAGDAPLAAFWPFLYVHDGIVRCKLLVQLADATLVLLEAGDGEAWRREEALASVEDATFVSMAPLSLPRASTAATDPLSFASRMGAQLAQLQGLRAVLDLPGLVQAYIAQRATYRGGVSEEASHNFGFARIAVVLTAPDALGRLQKVFGIDVRDGSILWSCVLPSSGWRLLSSRSEAHKGLAPEVLLLLTGSHSTKVLALDALSGEVQHEETLSAKVDTVVDLGATDPSTSSRILALVSDADSDAPRAQLYPTGAVPPRGLGDALHFHHVDREAGALRSFALGLGSNSTQPGAVELGVLRFASSSERVAQVAYGDASSIKSATHELGDGSLLIKYLNPNLAAIVTLDADAAAADAQESAGSSGVDEGVAPGEGSSAGGGAASLFVNAVDAVSGKLLYRVGHRFGAGPLHLTVHENWIIYAYWNGAARRSEIGSIALFEGHVARTGLNPFNKPERSTAFSAFDDEPPVALQRSFEFPHGIRALGITKTAAGITPRACVVGMESGQLFMLDRRLLDPRRPKEAPKKSEKEEGLLQYTPFLPLHAARYVNYNATIVGLRQIFTAPTRLESTTLVLGVGVDLYGSRATPAKSFDLLSADFNKPLLLLVLAGFVGGTVILRTLYRTRRLKQQWK